MGKGKKGGSREPSPAKGGPRSPAAEQLEVVTSKVIPEKVVEEVVDSKSVPKNEDDEKNPHQGKLVFNQGEFLEVYDVLFLIFGFF
jgi:hypothetical protein